MIKGYKVLRMINAIRLANRAQLPPSVLSNPLAYHIARNNSDIRFVTSAGQPDNNNMDQTKKPEQDKAADTMSSSYGEAYATRSDEEGFGGIYGGNKEDEENIKHGKAPECETKQGSEVKEKEKARNQPQAA
ncbi:hypothetical protein R3W88_004729 [Solanum pinnatisectum]|uniref:Late embryogenesis abundant protein n=1 Tax=Solanum pinnatisectum TaxID=50273 RepID=A0AAV9KA63_9SOLN|nr:hypothetical protein R3W88_004729 [Solanum pinnatisectum]